MPDMYNPDFTAPEIKNAIDAVSAQKTAEVIGYFREVAKTAVLAAMPEADRQKLAADRLTKVAEGKLPGAMLASIFMHETSTNKEASLAGAANVRAMREKIASSTQAPASTPAPAGK